MKSRILIIGVFLLISSALSAQFVGDGAPKPAATNVSAKPKASFTMKYGLAMPLGNFGTVPVRSSISKYTNGVMGAKTGFFAEIGVGMNFSNTDKMVAFYYYPFLASYWKTSLDWSSLGGFFKDKAIYTKPVRAIDIGQRYGVVVKPIKDLSVALYYRPGLVIPLDFEVNNKTATTAEPFNFSGTMATGEGAPVFILSSSPGLSVKYMMAVISLEGYFVKPAYDVTYKDFTVSPTTTTTMGKIPVKMFILSIGLCF